MKKKVLFQFIIFLPLCLMAQIGAKVKSNKITGIWQYRAAGIQMILILHQDGSGEFDGEMIKYSVEDNKLRINIPSANQTNEYSFSLTENVLTLSGGDLDAPVSFTRSGLSADQTASTIPSAKNVQSAPNTQVNKNDPALLGTWAGNGESIEFKDNNQCLYLGQTYNYTLREGNCILKTQQGEIPMAYSINGNLLSLIVNGKTLIYSRNNTANQNNFPTNNNKRIAPELVGTWCYTNVNSTSSGSSSSNQCFTLNSDGSYTYSGESSRSVNTNSINGGTASQGNDRGTWSYDGDRIYYVSSGGAGSGSAVLVKRNHPKNNDPMIVLDGKTYVTFYQKDPWR